MFVSIGFLIFLGCVIGLFFLLPKKCRLAVLLLASYAFCGYLSMRALLVLIIISVGVWFAGIKVEKARESGKAHAAKTYICMTLCLGIALLCIYKYVPCLLQNSAIAQRLPQSILEQLIMPVGLSFYMFQAIGYLVDIYQGKSPAEKNFFVLGCYFAFFAKLISGPIERENTFIPQLKQLETVKFWDRGRLSTAFTYMLWGYFMKMVVADRLAIIVAPMFDNPKQFDSLVLISGAFFYALQIYSDFAGYSYIAIGCARIFDIRLTQNFEMPYCARTVTEFWRRWHISLSSWLRDYIYIPLGGNRRGIFRKCVNTLIVFLICGMWHGVGLNFIIWGLLHGACLVMETLLAQRNPKRKGSRILTFLTVAFAWIFFRAQNLESAVSYIIQMFSAGFWPGRWTHMASLLQLNSVEVLVIAVSTGLIWLVDILCYRKKMHLPMLIQEKQNATRYMIFYLLIISIFIFGIYGPGYHAEHFIYMQF